MDLGLYRHTDPFTIPRPYYLFLCLWDRSTDGPHYWISDCVPDHVFHWNWHWNGDNYQHTHSDAQLYVYHYANV